MIRISMREMTGAPAGRFALTHGGAASVLLCAAAAGLGSTAASAQAACSSTGSGPLDFICGPQNAEDIVRLGDSNWLIASGMSSDGLTGGGSPGNLYLIDREARSYEAWFPGEQPAFEHDQTMFPDCPGPLNTEAFSAHGLALQAQPDDRYKLYITSHGEREAIEMFEIDASSDAKPSITWVGCVTLAETTSANSVAILEDGGFVTTKMMDPTNPSGFQGVMSGEITGEVFAWHPGGEVAAVPGTELSGANGIELSPDQRYLYVAAIGTGEVVRYDLETLPLGKQTVSIPVRPDNLRWTEDGKLLTIGGDVSDSGAPAAGWSVIEVDPQTLDATRIAGADNSSGMSGTSVALEVEGELWIGTFRGDRIGIMPRP